MEPLMIDSITLPALWLSIFTVVPRVRGLHVSGIISLLARMAAGARREMNLTV